MNKFFTLVLALLFYQQVQSQCPNNNEMDTDGGFWTISSCDGTTTMDYFLLSA